jgi:hypothetical protein
VPALEVLLAGKPLRSGEDGHISRRRPDRLSCRRG